MSLALTGVKSRMSEYFTSLARIGFPSANFASRLSVKVQTVLSDEAVQDVSSAGFT